MPTTINVAPPANVWAPQDTDRYNRLPIMMTLQEVAEQPVWERWNGIGGTIPWKPNMADQLQGVIAEQAPIVRQSFAPRNITEQPLTDVSSYFERANIGRPKRHHFESPIFGFLPSFRDFRKNQVATAQRSLIKQRTVATDMFKRTQAFGWAPQVYVVRKSGDPLVQLPSGDTTDTSSPKSFTAIADMIQNIGFDDIGYLNYNAIVAARAAARHTIGMQPMNGWRGKPADNETAKGKYLLIGEPGIYENMQFDQHLLNNRVLSRELVTSDFKGVIAENIVFREECYPHILALDQTTGVVSEPPPEIDLRLPNTAYGSSYNFQTIPNPLFTHGLIGVAYLIGAEPWDDLKVGAPPAEFTGSMTAAAFGKLQWNAEMRVIAPSIIQWPGGVVQSNDYGGWLKIICDATFGFLPKTPRNVLPIFYRRNLYPSLLLN